MTTQQTTWLDSIDDLRAGDVIVPQFGADRAPLVSVEAVDGSDRPRAHFSDGTTARLIPGHVNVRRGE